MDHRLDRPVAVAEDLGLAVADAAAHVVAPTLLLSGLLPPKPPLLLRLLPLRLLLPLHELQRTLLRRKTALNIAGNIGHSPVERVCESATLTYSALVYQA